MPTSPTARASWFRAALSAALLLCAVAAHAALSEASFADVRNVLQGQWSQWVDRCGEIGEIERIENEAGLKSLQEIVAGQRACLNQVAAAIARRTEAQPLVNASFWDGMSEAQKTQLQGDLRRANEGLVRRVEARLADQVEKANRLAEQYQARRDEGMTETLRSCIRRFDGMLETQNRIAEINKGIESRSEHIDSLQRWVRMSSTQSEYARNMQAYNNAVSDRLAEITRRQELQRKLKRDAERYDERCVGISFPQTVVDSVCGATATGFCGGLVRN